jgi:hypothetical protein
VTGLYVDGTTRTVTDTALTDGECRTKQCVFLSFLDINFIVCVNTSNLESRDIKLVIHMWYIELKCKVSEQ